MLHGIHGSCDADGSAYTDHDGEYIIPERYSMAPVFRASSEYLEAEDKAALYCSTGRLPAEASPELYEFLLEKNLLGAKTGGGHIGLYAPARTLVFSLVLSVPELTAARLSNALERFAETATKLIVEVEERLSSSVDMTEISPLMGNMLWV